MEKINWYDYPVIILGLPFILIWLIIIIIKDNIPNKKTRKIAILGEVDSGKTVLWCKLQDKPYTKRATYKEQIKQFPITRKDGTIVYVENTYDIGGLDRFVGEEYKEIIKDGTFVYYLVDLTKLQEKRDTTRQRLTKIATIFKDRKDCGINIIGTYFDKYNGSREKAKEDIQNIIWNKKLPIKLRHIHVINTFNQEDIDVIKNEITNFKN